MTSLVSIDIGSHKVCTLVSQLYADGQVRINGIGHAPAEGVKRGVITNVEEAAGAVAASVERAQRLAGERIDGAVVSVSGQHIEGTNSEAVVSMGRRARTIDEQDVGRCMEAAQAVALDEGRELLHVLPRGFVLDGQTQVETPIGMQAHRLEGRVHLVTAASSALTSLRRCLEMAEVEPSGLVLGSLATAEATLTPDERELGVAVVDIGAGTTDIAVFRDGTVIHTAVLPIGGQHFTSDLAILLQTPLESAETLKLNHGCVLDGHTPLASVEVAPFGTGQQVRVQRKLIAEILNARGLELLGMVRQVLDEVTRQQPLPAGIVLAGGTADLGQLPQLATQVTGMPARVGQPMQIGGLVDRLQNPAHATSAGLLLWAVRQPHDAVIVEHKGSVTGHGGLAEWLRRAFVPWTS